jgi:hypothetical protein
MFGKLSRSFGLLTAHDIPSRINRPPAGRAAPTDPPISEAGRREGSEAEPRPIADETKPSSKPR